MLTYVDLETARNAQQPCLVLLRGVPSPWSQAAKAIFELKGIDALAVWMNAGDAAVSAWTGMPNGPVLMVPGEAPRASWADILARAERWAPTPRLLPVELEARVRALGLCHEVMGERGLMWNGRLVMLDVSHATAGARGFPLPIAEYLGARYGYTPGCAEAAHVEVRAALNALDAQLARGRAAGGPYYFGDQLCALDIYSTAVVDVFMLLPDEQCPMRPKLRAAFESLRDEVGDVMPPSLLVHRDLMHERHMPLPIAL
jgi:glutathione S-transferase